MKRNIDEAVRPDLSALLEELPPWVSRKHPRFKELIGYSPRSLANLDSLKQTQAIKRIMLAGAVAYEKQSLIKWLEERSRVIA